MIKQRNPSVAAWLSIVPGLGQVYNRQFRKAMFFPVTTGLSLATAIILISSGDRLSSVHIGAIAALFLGLAAVVTFMVLFILGLALWASAVVDARRSAEDLSSGRRPTARWWLLRL